MLVLQRTIESPIGDIRICASGNGLMHVCFFDTDIANANNQDESVETSQNAQSSTTQQMLQHLDDCQSQLNRYFNKDLTQFNLRFDMQGTDFQCRVWNHLSHVAFGFTKSYGEIALELGDEKSVRAVATANAHNSLNIVIPCHRVLSQDGKLSGYNGGLWRKEWLLRHEGVLL